jgi:hypothetical protein
LNNAPAEKIQTRAAVFLRRIEHPKPEGSDLFVQRPQQILRHLLAFRPILPLQRDEFLVDETTDGPFKNLQLFGQVKVHDGSLSRKGFIDSG